MAEQIIRVVCAVIVQDGLVLAARRGPAMDQPGKWEFPGGKVDPGESEADALVREIREELALDVQPEQRLATVRHRTEGRTIELLPFRCRLAGGTLRLCEHQEVRWCRPPELWSLDWAPADRPVVEEVQELLT